MKNRDRTNGGGFWDDFLEWIGERGLLSGQPDKKPVSRGTLETALKKPVLQVSWWACFGGIAFFLFLVQVLTGVLLMFFYVPQDPGAHRTVLFMSGEAPYGWFFRTIHSWAGVGMMVSLTIHVLRVLVKGAYRNPRDLNWVVGCLLFLFTAGFLLTGDLLPWTQSAYWSAVWWTDLVGHMPLLGRQLMLFLRGGEHVTGSTLARFYVFHVVLLPALSMVFMVLHFAIVRKLGPSEPL